MMQELVRKAEFARLAGVNGSTITRVARTVLKAAMVGDLIDKSHPDAVEYLDYRDVANTPPAATNLDPLYEKAVRYVLDGGRMSVRGLKISFGIGEPRASALLDVLRATGIAPPAEPKPKPKPVAAPEPKPPPEPKQPPKPRGWAAKKINDRAAEAEKEPVKIPDDMTTFYDMKLLEIVELFGTDNRFETWLNAVQKIEGINEKRLKNATTEGKLVSRSLIQANVLDNIDGVFTRMLTDGAQTISNRAHAIANSGGSAGDVRKVVDDLLMSFIKPAKVKMKRGLQNA